MPATNGKIQKYIKPMLATAADEAFNHPDWIFELKFDGYRAVTEKKGKQVLLYSRNGLDLGARYAPVTKALAQLPADAVLDGEIVVLNKKGMADFQELQQYEEAAASNLFYYVFDILRLGKEDLTHLPLLERKQILEVLLTNMPDPIRYSDHVAAKGKTFFSKVKAKHMEGMMAKESNSTYSPGVRTRQWLKIKYQLSQEAVILGYTQPRGSRLHFGALLLGEYRNGKLAYIGHAGTGFTEATLKELMQRMQPLVVPKSPLTIKVKSSTPATWVQPKLVCEIGFTERTKDGMLRHPVYKGLRPDKKSRLVTTATEKPKAVKKLVHP